MKSPLRSAGEFEPLDAPAWIWHICDMTRPLRRRSVRLQDHNYTFGDYLLTICTHERRHSLGSIPVDRMRASPLGEIVETAWWSTVDRMPTVECDAFVVMPNHVHAVVEVRADPNVRHGSGGVASLVSQFKRSTWDLARHPPEPIWQRGYHESVLSSGRAVDAAIAYVRANPSEWRRDPMRMDRMGPGVERPR